MALTAMWEDRPLERGFVGFPTGLDDEYFRMLTAERACRRNGRRPHRIQMEKDAAQANEALDTMNQAEVAAILYGIRDMPEAIWDRP